MTQGRGGVSHSPHNLGSKKHEASVGSVSHNSIGNKMEETTNASTGLWLQSHRH